MVQRAFQADAAYVGTAMITIRVGSGKQKSDFSLPEKLVREASQFIDAAMNGAWLESQGRVILLPDFDHDTFSIYFQWLLTGKLHSKQRYTKPTIPITATYWSLNFEIVALGELVRLAHDLLDTDFRDTLNDGIIQCAAELQRFKLGFPAYQGSCFYDDTPCGSPTRQLIKDLCAWTSDECMIGSMGKSKEDRHPDFIMDLLQAVTWRFMSSNPGTSPLEGWETSCKYHCHGKEKPCYRKKSTRSSEPTKKRAVPDDTEPQPSKRRA
ncbi:uncharacterized protein K460DRAFT_415740 [Cucurbitaria berberidis CBS 394.84]|uniref:BTB domain-containing protein n=1 Tax=Cucurbitaria berberidis CBS 394.84 TaxID=1168544 RepID=A0A9P4GPD2_9PLEO|nr:uncharacterized protein K460DRAFT_415740 [Cucurbitaria berberidis CBS 394.84]KAF1849362.1 hypothetical protein K460DRAFT_415740 [Cucurbitaria berberidis CBS 394.84]